MKVKTILFLMLVMVLASCGIKYHGTNTSVFADYLWTIPTATGAGAIFCLIACLVGSKSNSTQQTKQGTNYNAGNVKWTKVGYFPWFVGLTIGTVVILLMMIAAR